MMETLAVSGYRSLRNLVLPLGQLNLVTGANGTGKSSLYRALRLLADAALNTVVASLAREGGLPSTLWAGPEKIARSVRQGEYPVQGTVRQDSVSLKLGFAGNPYSYCIDLGYPPPPPETSLHPDLLPALARLIFLAARRTQIVVVSHAQILIQALEQNESCRRLHLEKSFGETMLAGSTLFNKPKWEWPVR